MRRTVVKNHRRWILVPLTVAAVGLAFASVAWACTTIVGSISTTAPAPNPNPCPNGPPAGCQVHPGDTISSTATGVGVAPKWSLYFLNYKSTQDGMNTCMSKVPFSEQKVAGPVTQSGGQVSGSGQIPLTALPSSASSTPKGPALVCWIDSNSTGVPNYNYATPPTELNVL